jgi:hypothetical protein
MTQELFTARLIDCISPKGLGALDCRTTNFRAFTIGSRKLNIYNMGEDYSMPPEISFFFRMDEDEPTSIQMVPSSKVGVLFEEKEIRLEPFMGEMRIGKEVVLKR